MNRGMLTTALGHRVRAPAGSGHAARVWSVRGRPLEGLAPRSISCALDLGRLQDKAAPPGAQMPSARGAGSKQLKVMIPP